MAASTLAVFRAVVDARRRFGAQAIGLYIISMSRSAADALSVLALARLAGCVAEGHVPLDVSPLFETVADLPWNERTDDRLDLELARQILERDHYGLAHPEQGHISRSPASTTSKENAA